MFDHRLGTFAHAAACSIANRLSCCSSGRGNDFNTASVARAVSPSGDFFGQIGGGKLRVEANDRLAGLHMHPGSTRIVPTCPSMAGVSVAILSTIASQRPIALTKRGSERLSARARARPPSLRAPLRQPAARTANPHIRRGHIQAASTPRSANHSQMKTACAAIPPAKGLNPSIITSKKAPI